MGDRALPSYGGDECGVNVLRITYWLIPHVTGRTLTKQIESTRYYSNIVMVYRHVLHVWLHASGWIVRFTKAHRLTRHIMIIPKRYSG